MAATFRSRANSLLPENRFAVQSAIEMLCLRIFDVFFDCFLRQIRLSSISFESEMSRQPKPSNALIPTESQCMLRHTESTGDVKIMEFFAWRCASTLLCTHNITQRTNKKNNKEFLHTHTFDTTTDHHRTKVQLFSENSERTDKME